MDSIITKEILENFYIRLYFSVKNGDYLSAAISRAYRDFNRTIDFKGLNEEDKGIWRDALIEILKEKIVIALEKKFSEQEEFTLWHQSVCYHLISNSNKILSLGQAQKWINMTLKYLFTLGESRIKGITNNYQFFHIPIDSIIQEKLFSKYSIPMLEMPWSKIPDYNTYHVYQKEVRNAIKDRIVMDEEFLLFNES